MVLVPGIRVVASGLDVYAQFEKPGPPQSAGGFSPFYTPDPPFQLRVEVSVAEGDPTHLGRHVGLTQTLLESHKVATYQSAPINGNCRFLPTHDPPILDAREDVKLEPFYDNELYAELSDGVTNTFTLKDNPGFETPDRCWNLNTQDPNIMYPPLQSIEVREKLVTSLYDRELDQVIRQWTWGYSYTVVRDIMSRPQRRVTQHEEDDVAELGHGHFLPIEITGPVATADLREKWSPGFARIT